MGDRGNIVIRERNGGEIYLYTHWGGSSLPLVLRSALDRSRDRWDDESYLARIIFSEMIAGDVHGTTGYGISTYRVDENHPDIVVDIAAQRVRMGVLSRSFDEYVRMDAQFDEEN